jgi:hypothetical protein
MCICVSLHHLAVGFFCEPQAVVGFFLINDLPLLISSHFPFSSQRFRSFLPNTRSFYILTSMAQERAFNSSQPWPVPLDPGGAELPSFRLDHPLGQQAIYPQSFVRALFLFFWYTN